MALPCYSHRMSQGFGQQAVKKSYKMHQRKFRDFTLGRLRGHVIVRVPCFIFISNLFASSYEVIRVL